MTDSIKSPFSVFCQDIVFGEYLSVAAFSKDNALRVVFHGDMLLSHILTVTFEWFVLKEIFFAQK